jgi:hypothetical protein
MIGAEQGVSYMLQLVWEKWAVAPGLVSSGFLPERLQSEYQDVALPRVASSPYNGASTMKYAPIVVVTSFEFFLPTRFTSLLVVSAMAMLCMEVTQRGRHLLRRVRVPPSTLWQHSQYTTDGMTSWIALYLAYYDISENVADHILAPVPSQCLTFGRVLFISNKQFDCRHSHRRTKVFGSILLKNEKTSIVP